MYDDEEGCINISSDEEEEEETKPPNKPVGAKRSTSNFCQQNAKWTTPLSQQERPKVTRTKFAERYGVNTSGHGWKNFKTSHLAMLEVRDQICRFADDTFGFGKLKYTGCHDGGYDIPQDVIEQLLDYQATIHHQEQISKKKRGKKPSSKLVPCAKISQNATLLGDFSLTYHTLHYLMKWSKSGWLNSTTLDFLADVVNLSLGHAPNDNLYPVSFFADSLAAESLVPNEENAKHGALLMLSSNKKKEKAFEQCMRKEWFPKVKDPIRFTLFTYAKLNMNVPKISLMFNKSGTHWETMMVKPSSLHIESVDPYKVQHVDKLDRSVFYRMWVSKYFGMFQQMLDGNASPYAGHLDMLFKWDNFTDSRCQKRIILEAQIGKEPSSFSHLDINYK